MNRIVHLLRRFVTRGKPTDEELRAAVEQVREKQERYELLTDDALLDVKNESRAGSPEWGAAQGELERRGRLRSDGLWNQ